jgi:peptidyl-prolyl cis-trans isomerase C
VRVFRLCLGIVLLLALVMLLAACAGGDSDNESSDSSPQSTVPVDQSGGAADSTGTDSAAAGAVPVQATEEPLAAKVNGQPITLAEFQRERERRAMGLQVEPATVAAFDASVLQTMIDQVLIEQAAARLGIAVTDEEIDSELALQADLAAVNGQTLEEVVTSQLYTMDEYRATLRGMLLTQKVSEAVINVPSYTLQVHSRHILVADETTARALLEQIQQGTDFAQLAMQYSLDSSTAPTGGDLDWVSRGDLLQPEVEEVIFSLEPGQIAPEPVKSSLGYHIIQTLERVEDRPLSQVALAERRQQAFLDWLNSQRQAAVVERYVG